MPGYRGRKGVVHNVLAVKAELAPQYDHRFLEALRDQDCFELGLQLVDDGRDVLPGRVAGACEKRIINEPQ